MEHNLRPLGAALAALDRSPTAHNGEPSSPISESISDEKVCEICLEIHECRRCHDAKFGRKNGQAVPCPSCSVRPGDGSDLDAELVRMRVPLRYRACTVGSWNPLTGQPRRRAEDFVRSWPPENPLLLMTGTLGNGKTHLAIGALRAAFELHSVRGQFWPAVALLDRYRATFHDDTAVETVEEIDRQLRRLPLLVLDDLGTESGTPFVAERLFRLIDERYSEKQPLVVTSNVSFGELPERVRSRMKSASVAYFDGPDRRGDK